MNHLLRRISLRKALGTALVSLLSGMAIAETAPQAPKVHYPGRNEGWALGLGAGVKLLNLKNIATRTTAGGVSQRSGDSFANTSSPVISVYARKYIPDLLFTPAFFGLEFDCLTGMRKTSIYANFNNVPGLSVDTGFRYQERWDARAMAGAQVWGGSQLDLWAQVGLQVTNFAYEGRTTEATGSPQSFTMNNNYAFTPAVGLEVRYSDPNSICFCRGIRPDFIIGWTAGYRNAFKVMETSTGNNTYNIAMSSGWSHTFGLKLLFRY